MPLIFDGVRGRPSLMTLRALGSGTTKPTPVTATVAAAGAAAGVNTIPVAALAGAIAKNAVLDFSRAAGSPDIVRVVVTEDAAESAVEIKVESFEGAQGDGISHALAENDAATWDGLYTDVASNSLDFSANEQTNELIAVTHGGATGVRVSVPEVTSIQPTIQRAGLFLNDSPLLTALLQNVKQPNQNWWGRYILPDENGDPLFAYEGLGRVFGVGHPTPADNFVQLNYSFRFIRDAFTVTNLQAS